MQAYKVTYGKRILSANIDRMQAITDALERLQRERQQSRTLSLNK